jgi:hypothetical protein
MTGQHLPQKAEVYLLTCIPSDTEGGSSLVGGPTPPKTASTLANFWDEVTSMVQMEIARIYESDAGH